MSILSIIQNIVKIVDKAELDSPSTTSISFDNTVSLENAFAKALAPDPLKEYLQSLEIASIEYLVTLMYIGRDNRQVADFAEHHNNLLDEARLKGKKDDCIRKICEKQLNLKTYFNDSKGYISYCQ